MQTLSAFRAYEDNDVRRDKDDGRLRYEPPAGLQLRIERRGVEETWAGWRMTSSVQDDNIYAYCLSTELSEDLAQRLESPFCVEITNPVALVGRIRRAVALRSQLDRLFFGPVDYRKLDVIPGSDWAIPEKVGFIKPDRWAWQHEYRILVGKRRAFDVQNVRMTLETGPQPAPPAVDHPPLVLIVPPFTRGVEVHKF